MFTRIEVLKLMAHLVITLVLVIGYLVLVYVKGYSDETLKNSIMVIIGYWFGAMGIAKKGGNDKNEN